MPAIIAQVNFSHSLKKFERILRHLYGPKHSSLSLQNQHGATVKRVHSSVDLYLYIQPKCDVIKLMVAYLRNSCMLNKDGGLFTGLLACLLIDKLKSAKLPLNVLMETIDCYQVFVIHLVEQIKVHIDLGKLDQVQRILKPIITSKLLLTSDELQHVVLLFTKIFAEDVRSLSNVNVMRIDGNEISDSHMCEGILLQLDASSGLHKISGQRNLKVALVTVSISVDSEDLVADEGTKIQVESYRKFVDDVTISKLINFCVRLASHVDVIICQKVLHPLIKSYLENQHILYIDRIGGINMKYLVEMLSCQPISGLALSDFPAGFIGTAAKLNIIPMRDKTYLQVVAEPKLTIRTVVLCSRDEDQVNVLANCFDACMASLNALSNFPHAVFAGGCTETVIAMHVVDFMSYVDDVEPRFRDLPRHVLVEVSCIMCACLLDLAAASTNQNEDFEHFIDSKTHHHWINHPTATECCCGLFRKSDQKFISFLELKLQKSYNFSTTCTNSTRHEGTLLARILTSQSMYIANVSDALNLARSVLRIGCTVSST